MSLRQQQQQPQQLSKTLPRANNSAIQNLIDSREIPDKIQLGQESGPFSRAQENLREQTLRNEQRISFKCLQDNFGNKSQCEPQIENYKDCKTFWYNVYKERKNNRIKPYMPSIEERIKIKKEYMSGH